jgi:hypothetical protein
MEFIKHIQPQNEMKSKISSTNDHKSPETDFNTHKWWWWFSC